MARRMTTGRHKLGERVNVTPGLPDGVAPVYGVRRRLFGFDVIEVGPRYYLSADGKYQAERFSRSEGAEFTGWIVSRPSDPSSATNLISTKRDAIEVLDEMARVRGSG